MVRKVKGGSSARPRLKNEAMPASVTATMMKTMKERCFSAQSERLSRSRSRSEEPHLLARMQRLDARRHHDVAGLEPRRNDRRRRIEPLQPRHCAARR